MPRRRWQRRRTRGQQPRPPRPARAARNRWHLRQPSTASSRPSRSSAPCSRASPTRPRCRKASQQFNAAAVALEMSWLRLFADAGCLTDEQAVQAEAAVRDYTTTLQQSLLDAGYYDGEVDGVYGPATVDAIEALQQAHGLPSTGTVDKATAAALQSDLAAKGGAIAQEAVASTAAVQQTLKLAGFWDGPVDGEWTPELTKALKDFQTELGVKPTGTVDAATVAALEKAIAKGRSQPSRRRPATPPHARIRQTPARRPADDRPIVRIGACCRDTVIGHGRRLADAAAEDLSGGVPAEMPAHTTTTPKPVAKYGDRTEPVGEAATDGTHDHRYQHEAGHPVGRVGRSKVVGSLEEGR